MTQDEFAEGVAKLKAFYRAIGPDWAVAVYSKHGYLPADVWRKACDLMLDERVGTGVPSPQEINLYIGKARDAGVGPPRESVVCGRCKGDRFINNDQQFPDGRLIPAVSPCPTCNRNCKVNSMPVPEGTYYTVRDPFEWTEKTVRYVMSQWDVELDPADPAGSRQEFMALWKTDPKPPMRGNGGIAGALSRLKIEEPARVAECVAVQTPVADTQARVAGPLPTAAEPEDDEFRVDVEHLSKDERSLLNAQAEAEDIPF